MQTPTVPSYSWTIQCLDKSYRLDIFIFEKSEWLLVEATRIHVQDQMNRLSRDVLERGNCEELSFYLYRFLVKESDDSFVNAPFLINNFSHLRLTSVSNPTNSSNVEADMCDCYSLDMPD
jgi:hypothetical protein